MSVDKPSREAVGDALAVLTAISDTIRDAGEIPSGVLYSGVMAFGASFQQYESILEILKGAGVIEVTGAHLVRWIGPVGVGCVPA